MTSVPGVDHPEEQTEAEITLTGRGVSVSSRVEVVQNEFISVRPSVGEFVEQVVVKVGDVVEVFWKTEEAQRALPAVITDVETGAVVRWRMRSDGPAEPSQRRKAVRGRISVQVVAGYGSIELKGETIDLSEAGLRAEFEGLGAPPEAGAELDLSSALEDGETRRRPRSCGPRPAAPAGSCPSGSSTSRSRTRTASAGASSRRCARSGRARPTTRRPAVRG